MQQNEMVRKIKMQLDGDEIIDIIRWGEFNLEDAAPTEIPSFNKIFTRISGTVKINPIDIEFKTPRNKETATIIRDWVIKNEVKDVTVIECDGHGVEYNRQLFSQCEAANLIFPENDFAAPTFAKNTITIYPEDFDTVE